jgi:hypothetical protein
MVSNRQQARVIVHIQTAANADITTKKEMLQYPGRLRLRHYWRQRRWYGNRKQARVIADIHMQS